MSEIERDICNLLLKMFGGDPEQVEWWMRTPSVAFGGDQSAEWMIDHGQGLEVMLESLLAKARAA